MFILATQQDTIRAAQFRETHDVYGVFSSIENARQFAASCKIDDGFRWIYRESPVDPAIYSNPQVVQKWLVL